MPHEKGGINIHWFNILKVEDITFDENIDAFGEYALRTKDPMPVSRAMSYIGSGKLPKLEELVEESIKINHKKIYRYLKEKLSREPTEREIQEYIVRTIMHEGTHAAMGLDQLPMSDAQQEYGAFAGQFPDNTYLRMKQFLLHPDAGKMYLDPRYAKLFDAPHSSYSQPVEDLSSFVAMVDAVTDIFKDNTKKMKIKEKWARLEITARTRNKNMSLKDLDPTKIDSYVKRYGDKHKNFFRKLLASNMGDEQEFSDKELKMVGAVTTTSAPAMFNKVVRGRKKRRKKDARR